MLRAVPLLAPAVVLLALLDGCTAGTATSTSTASATASASATPTASPLGDGILRIGTLFPSTGPTSFLGAPQVAAVKAAVADINAAGGVNGKPVEVVSDDSGDASTQTAEASLADLVAKKVDVIIGPDSSVLAQRLLVPAAAAQIPMVSPAATSPVLSTVDGSGILFRTIASAGHQGSALGALLPTRGQKDIAVIASSDPVGQAIVQPLGDALQAHAGKLTTTITLTSSSDPAAIAAQLKTAAPDAVVLDTQDNGAQTKALITQLTGAGFRGAKLWLTSGNLADYSQALPAGTLTGSNGILEGASTSTDLQNAIKKVDPSVSTFAYAPEAYDATILVALAATLARDDNGLRVAAKLQAASVGGIKCTTYAECLDVLKTEPAIDYDGVSGPVNLDADGDPTSGTYGIYSYGADDIYGETSTVTG